MTQEEKHQACFEEAQQIIESFEMNLKFGKNLQRLPNAHNANYS